MAKGPTSKIKRRLIQSIIRETEKRIDRAIEVNLTDAEIFISLSELPGLTVEMWAELGLKYKDAGWRTARWMCDPREGDYIHLRA
jgi:hypothetical protein